MSLIERLPESRLFRWRSLRTKIIAWSFVPTALILIIVALVTFTAYQRVTEDLVIERNQQLTRLLADQIAAQIEQHANLLAEEAILIGFSEEEIPVSRSVLLSARDRLNVFDEGVLLLDASGRLIGAAPDRPDALGQDWSNRSYYREVFLTKRPYVSNVVPDGLQDAEVLVIAVPVRGLGGEFLGVLAGMLRLGARGINSFYGDPIALRIGEGGSAYLVDGKGRAIYHTTSELIGTDLSGDAAVRKVLSGQSGAVRTRDVRGHEIAASFAPVPGSSWGLIDAESWAVLNRAGQGYRTFLIVLLALGVAIPALVAAIGVRRITRPIEELIEAARRIAAGDYGHTIIPGTVDELEQLARQFNRMSLRLQESYATLEQRVADRTRELATLNAVAQTVGRSLDLQDMLASTLDKVLEVLEFEAGAVYLRDETTGVLSMVCERGLPERVRQVVARGIVSKRAALSTVPILIPDLLESGGEAGELAAEGYRAVASIPLIAKKRVEGVLSAACRSPRSFTPQDSDLLISIGHQIAVAIENARLYEQAQQAAAGEERQRLARELHDAVTQTLFSTTLIADVLPRIWEKDPEQGRQRLEELRQLTRGALAEMRTLLLELRPAALIDADLEGLIHQLAESVYGRARIPIEVTIDGKCALAPDFKVALYRLAQEALNNVAKHSNAHHATVSLVCEPQQVRLCVCDDGCGFDQSSVAAERLGLGIMRERAKAIGAALSIESATGQGTQVTVVWPGD